MSYGVVGVHLTVPCVGELVCGGDRMVWSPLFLSAVPVAENAQQQCAFAAIVFTAFLEQPIHEMGWQSGADAGCLLRLGLAFVCAPPGSLEDCHSPSLFLGPPAGWWRIFAHVSIVDDVVVMLRQLHDSGQGLVAVQAQL